MTHQERQKLEIDHSMQVVMSDPEMVPKWHKCKSKDPQKIYESRMIRDTDKMGAVMASYGVQHQLPDDLLREKGYHGWGIRTGGECRLVSPWEIAAAMGFTPDLALPEDPRHAYRLTGNALSPAHAAIACVQAQICRQTTDNPGLLCNPEHLASKVREGAIKLSLWVTKQRNGWERLESAILQDTQYSPTILYEAECKTLSEETAQPPSGKKKTEQREENTETSEKTEEKIEHFHPNREITTLKASPTADAHNKVGMIPFVLTKADGRYAAGGWAWPYATAEQVIRTALGDVNRSHITELTVNGEAAQWNTRFLSVEQIHIEVQCSRIRSEVRVSKGQLPNRLYYHSERPACNGSAPLRPEHRVHLPHYTRIHCSRKPTPCRSKTHSGR